MQDRIEHSAQPFTDTKAAGMSGFVFATAIDLYHARGPAQSMCWVVPQLSRSNDRCITCGIIDRWLSSVHTPVVGQ